MLELKLKVQEETREGTEFSKVLGWEVYDNGNLMDIRQSKENIGDLEVTSVTINKPGEMVLIKGNSYTEDLFIKFKGILRETFRLEIVKI